MRRSSIDTYLHRLWVTLLASCVAKSRNSWGAESRRQADYIIAHLPILGFPLSSLPAITKSVFAEQGRKGRAFNSARYLTLQLRDIYGVSSRIPTEVYQHSAWVIQGQAS